MPAIPSYNCLFDMGAVCCQFDDQGTPTDELSEIALAECVKIDSTAKTGELQIPAGNVSD